MAARKSFALTQREVKHMGQQIHIFTDFSLSVVTKLAEARHLLCRDGGWRVAWIHLSGPGKDNAPRKRRINVLQQHYGKVLAQRHLAVKHTTFDSLVQGGVFPLTNQIVPCIFVQGAHGQDLGFGMSLCLFKKSERLTVF